ncbi:hypothetical protein [Pseudoalteromonas sp. PPB1]|uniref:hypothetical protein n=1 Tax=Pseudoalteromonas sp. PPB1 TaxID=2756136 RepID=UPI001890CF38|nr:hypothetical protein [Pseudoalteromonas sp. PPB1]
MSVVNLLWNKKITLTSDSLEGFKELKGDLWEYLVKDTNNTYRVFRSFFDNKYYVYELIEPKGETLIAKLHCNGDFETYLNKKTIKDFVWFGSQYSNLAEGKLKIDNYSKIYLNDELVAFVGGENRVNWFFKVVLHGRKIRYRKWSGIKYNSFRINERLALSLVVSYMANLD